MSVKSPPAEQMICETNLVTLIPMFNRDPMTPDLRTCVHTNPDKNHQWLMLLNKERHIWRVFGLLKIKKNTTKGFLQNLSGNIKKHMYNIRIFNLI